MWLHHCVFWHGCTLPDDANSSAAVTVTIAIAANMPTKNIQGLLVTPNWAGITKHCLCRTTQHSILGICTVRSRYQVRPICATLPHATGASSYASTRAHLHTGMRI